MNEDLRDCPGHIVIARLAERWATLIVEALADRSHRHSELRRVFPDLTQKMLTQTLRGLERDGLVERRVDASVSPAQVHYSLTRLGDQFFDLQRTLHGWAELHVGSIRSARARFDSVVQRGDRPSVIELNRAQTTHLDEDPTKWRRHA